ncbi:hypothetical protein IAR55_006676 [Kwoniella newhampshirensis]|uniref:aminodeoxychorismate synthase n=1 Tax=Kwoniella newhampshirensis TaxID=1651941 RepID=A0AAW0YTP4_9TREE
MISSRPPLPRTLILDYYDSYTNNLLTLFTQLYTDAEVLNKVVVIKADKYTWADFQEHVLPQIDCIILSPGPGRPDNPADIGFALDLLRLHPIPILGVCLGHQAIGVAFGGKIVDTPQITHGHVVPVAPVQPSKGLFASSFWHKSSEESDQFDAVVYNSLTVDPASLPDELEVTAWSVASDAFAGRPSTIQGLKHKSHPIWGVQYHPESISSTRGAALLQAFIDQVYLHHERPSSFPTLHTDIISSCAYRVAARAAKLPRSRKASVSGLPTPPITPTGSRAPTPSGTRNASKPSHMAEKRYGEVGRDLKTQEVFEKLVRNPSRKGKEKAIGEVWLDGQTPTRPTTTSLASPSFLITYSLVTRTVTVHRPSSTPATIVLPHDTTFWDWFSHGNDVLISTFGTRSSRANGWRGGWVGWFGYEMKEESLQGYRRRAKDAQHETEVDAAWAWSDKLLERTSKGEWIARGVLRDDAGDNSDIGLEVGSDMIGWLKEQGLNFGLSKSDWEGYLDEIQPILNGACDHTVSASADAFPTFQPSATGEDYRQRIDSCREAIRQGESYELTLTTRFNATTPRVDHYTLYLRLRSFNPAYYSTYINFPCLSTPRGQGMSILSSSPERFLRIDGDRRVEMMPIKGTRARVKPGQCVCVQGRGCEGKAKGSEECLQEGREEDARRGEDLRNDHKERAENLMIVDLIRSDLLSCCIPSTVTVPKLIALESYGVHNLVTTVQGTLAENVGSVEAVKRCFPPGSMTGAPKLRSVQLLDDFEKQQRRGIYSGALGYFSVDGVTDLSVVIRTITVEGNNLSIGAGGAITWLSDRDGEWDEVLTKVKSVVGVLDGVE